MHVCSFSQKAGKNSQHQNCLNLFTLDWSSEASVRSAKEFKGALKEYKKKGKKVDKRKLVY